MKNKTLKPNHAHYIGVENPDGRRVLIRSAIQECITIQNVIKNIEYISNHPISKSLNEENEKGMKDFIENHPEKKPGLFTVSMVREYYKKYPSPALSETDHYVIRGYLRSLIIVIFCQIFHSGNADKNLTPKNNKGKNLLEFQNIIEQQLSDNDKNSFTDIVTTSIRIRDKMIGHADGEAFNLESDSELTSHLMVNQELKSVDFCKLHKYLETIVKHYPLNSIEQ